MRLNFACLIFVARDDYENILTAKISRFTVVLYGVVHYLYSTWLGWVKWFVAKRATGSGVACTFRPQLCNMYIALTAGSIWNILHRR